MKNIMPMGFFHWLAKTLLSAVFAAAIVVMLGYFVLVTNNPIKAEIRIQAKQTFKDEVRNWLFSAVQEANP